MDYLKSTLSRAILGKDIPAFPYNIGTKVDSYDGVSIWELRSGTKKVLFGFSALIQISCSIHLTCYFS